MLKVYAIDYKPVRFQTDLNEGNCFTIYLEPQGTRELLTGVAHLKIKRNGTLRIIKYSGINGYRFYKMKTNTNNE